MTCKGCGAQLREDNRYCPYCGKEQEQRSATAGPKQEIHIHNHYDQPRERVVERVVDRVVVQPVYQEPVSSRSRVVMLVLCFFFGVVGAHRFYSGRIMLGLLYLVTGGFLGIGVMIDFFIILLGKPRDSKGRLIKW